MLKYIFVGIVSLLAIESIIVLLSTSVSAQVDYTHRRIWDDVAGNKAGWNPDGHKKVFGIVDGKFNPQTSIVLINTFNPVLPGVVCHVDYRGFSPAGPSFEVNCGGGNPGAVAPMDGVSLDYLIITMPFSPPFDIFDPAGGGVISLRGNITESTQMDNQTQDSNVIPDVTPNLN
jgi:hypothetical protein